MHPVARSALRVTFHNKCRISEVLALQSDTLLGNDQVFARASKRSAGFIIYLPTLDLQLSNFNACSKKVKLFPVSYMVVYRSCLRSGLVFHFSGRKNSVLTHCLRFLNSKRFINKFTERELGDMLKHRSSNSIQYYLK
jgi:hypothetical protein